MDKKEIEQKIQEIEDTLVKVEKELSSEDFADFSDASYTCITYLTNLKKIK